MKIPLCLFPVGHRVHTHQSNACGPNTVSKHTSLTSSQSDYSNTDMTLAVHSPTGEVLLAALSAAVEGEGLVNSYIYAGSQAGM